MHSTLVKRFYWSVLSVIVILAVSSNAVFAAPQKNGSAQGTVNASAVIVPAQVSELGFLISGIAKAIPVKEGDTVKAGQILIVLETPDLQFAVTEAEANLRSAQAKLEIRRNDIIKKIEINYITFTIKKLRLSVPHEEIEMEEGKVQRAQALIEIAKAKLGQGTLIAPFDGVITSLNVTPGEFVQSNQPVITLATLNTFQVETTDLSEHNVVNVHVGDPANIFIEALGQNISGKVMNISPKSNIIGGDVVFKVTIAPDTQPEGQLWGMTAEVEIQSGE